MAHNRSERVGDLIQVEVAGILLHGDLKDPRIGFVTVTRVMMSKDLKNAKILFSL
ncbi:MAG: ribosome-binding factor A, partial [Deltaproteobacteria bacterium]|nr:ribosome-binding factor A [Deltaproteobacteria bacterium]